MNQELQSIYRERVMEHSKHPHNFRRPEQPDREAIGFNPLCGDKITVYLQLDNQQLSDVAFEGTGCAISIASASMMSDALIGLPIERALQLIDSAEIMLKEESGSQDNLLDEFQALEGVRAYPSRIKCATLAWNAAKAAINKSSNTATHVSTE
jgi:nitrogen fixation NifU-like protein